MSEDDGPRLPFKKQIANALDRHDGLAVAAAITIMLLSVGIPGYGAIFLIHLFTPIGIWVVLPLLVVACVNYYLWNYVIFKEKPPQLPAPKTGLERITEQYALGEITFDQLEEKTEREIRGLPEPVIAPPALELPPPAKTIDFNATLRAKLFADVQKYQRENTPHDSTT